MELLKCSNFLIDYMGKDSQLSQTHKNAKNKKQKELVRKRMRRDLEKIKVNNCLVIVSLVRGDDVFRLDEMAAEVKIKGVEGYFWLGTDAYSSAGIFDVLYLLLYLPEEVHRRAGKLLGFIAAQDGKLSTKMPWHVSYGISGPIESRSMTVEDYT